MKKCLRLLSLVTLALAITLAAPYTASANAESQDTKNVSLTIQVKNKNMEEVFTEISSKTGLSFHYDKSDLNLKKKINLNCVKQPIDEVLQLLAEQTGLKFTRKNSKIIVNQEQHNGSLTSVTLMNGGNLAEKEIRGTVKDTKGAGLPGVTIVIKNTNKGTQTQANGSFVLSANPGDILVFRFLGFTSQEVAVGSAEVYDVVLEENSRSLSEFVVTALGIQKKSKELTYSTQQLNNDDLSRVRDVNVINSLTGKAAGVTITRSSSGLGGTARVIMRGNKSTRENQPLYVIDGVPMANFSPSQPANAFGQSSDIQSGAGRDGGDGISNINPDDIESINILKGASAAALYGSQAANGVIVISTKKGRIGKGRIDFTSDFTVESPSTLPKLQYRYGQTETPAAPGTATASWGSKVNAPNHVDDFFDKGRTWTNSVSFSGGNESAQTYVSYSNTSSKGIMPTSKFERHTINLRETFKLLNDRLSVDANVTFLSQQAHNRPSAGLYFNPLTGLYNLPRGVNFNTYKDKYEIFSTTRNMQTQNWWNMNTDSLDNGVDIQQNPYWILNRDQRDDKRLRAIASLSFKYQLTDWLSVQARGNYDKSYDEYELKAHATTQGTLAPTNGRYTLEREFNTQMYGDLILNANKKLSDRFTISGTLGTSITDLKARERTLQDVNVTSLDGLSIPNLFQIGNILPTALTQLQGLERRQTQAIFGSVNLGLNDYLFLDLTGRNDWSSTFAFTPTMKSGYFYFSTGVTAVVSEMVKLPEPINFAKVRFSFAKVGNSIAPYITKPSDFTLSTIGGQVLPNYNNRVPFPGTYLQPEDNRSLEGGFDIHFFQDRINLDVTLYKNNNYRQYIEIPAPSGSKYSVYFLNLGNIENKGAEIMLTAIPVKSKSFTWTTNVNYATNKNKIVKLSDSKITEQNWFTLTEFGSNMYGNLIQESGSWGDIYTPNRLLRNDKGQLIVNAGGKLDRESGRFNIGNPNPDFTLGWNNAFEYKDFTLNFLIDGRFGGKVMSLTQALLDMEGVSEASAQARDNGGVAIPNAVDANGNPFTGKMAAQSYYESIAGRDGIGEYYMYDATTIRLRELALSYKIPVKGIRSLRIGLIGRNLFFFKKEAPFDPEVSAGGDNRLQGVDIYGLPATRSFGASVKVGF